MRLVFRLPVNAEDPPAAAVVKKLEAVDAAREGLFAFGVARLVGAPDVGDVVPLLHPVGDRVFKEAFFAEKILASGGVFIRGQDAQCGCALVAAASGNHTSASVVEAAGAVPVALAGGTGDDVIDCGDDVVDRVHITGTRGRCGRSGRRGTRRRLRGGLRVRRGKGYGESER